MKYTIEEICRAVGAEAEGVVHDAVAAGWSIDSRTIRPGEIYFAIVGENHDGHKFVADSLAKGALAAVVRRDFTLPPGVEGGLIRCKEPLELMHSLASFSRDEDGLIPIGITGSCGKTTTKDLTAALLNRRFKAGKNSGNLNNIWGLPLALLRRQAGLDFYVCEMGMSYAGEMRILTKIARPDVAVLTNVHGVHLMNFASVREIAEAKAEMLEGVPADGVVVANADDPEVMRVTRGGGRRVVTFGLEAEADVAAARVEDRGIGGLRFELRAAGKTMQTASPLPGLHNLQNLLAAFATVVALDLDPMELVGGLEKLDMSPWRTHLVDFEDGWTLYDDAYNSNPPALWRTLETVVRSGGFERRIAVLGDMLELGENEKEEHRKAGRFLAESGIDILIALGPLAEEMAAAAREAGMDSGRVITVDDHASTVEAIEAILRPGDLVLVKGSRGVKMETVVEELTRRHRPAGGGEMQEKR